ncbi:MAG: amino acid adenylation domain-containing protein, partial [Cyanobacteria bacterium J06632_19]
NISVVDLQQFSKSERDALLEKQAQIEADTPFNLEIAPLIRCSLLQLDANEYVLFITMHHIISDDWSMGVFVEELSSLYQAFCGGEPSPLAELPIQYGDFAIWQKQWLSGEVLQTQLDYWVSQLAGAPELLQLPTDYPRPSIQNYQGTAKNWTLNTDLTQKLQNLSQKSGTTLFMTLLAGFTTLLHRYTNQADILIGSSIANRNRSEIEPLIGFFINNLVLRTIFEDNPTFDNLLQQVKENTLKAYDHQDVPFEQIVEAIQPQRSLAYSPLFQVMFDLQNSPGGTVELPDLTFSEFSQERAISQFDLTVSVTEVEGRLECEWEYNTDLFDGSTIERMATHFQNLLHGIVENPQQKVSELPLLWESERHQLLTEWNDTTTEYPTDKCVEKLFEQQVEKTPDAVAVSFAGEELTYFELNQRANQLAHHLQSLGVGAPVLVGICLERSIDMVVSVLAVLKAGGAYVPLDPNYPQERLNYILDDAAVEILITKSSLTQRLATNETKLVLIDDNQYSTATFCNPVNTTKPNHLAYVIYTSGSTGKPKATMIEHRGCVNHCYAMIDTLDLQARDTIAQTAPIGFDISVWQILTMLLVGGRVCVIKNEIIQEPSRFFEEIEAEEITVVQVVPSLLATMLDICDHWGAKNLSHLRWLSVTGEAFNANLMHWWFKYYPSIPLLNAYGPAECSDDVTLYPIRYGENSELLNSNTIPIGKPIANTQIYILDAHLNPLPIGVPGELYVGGMGVGRGYLNRPQLTSERFILSPFSSNPEDRLYKTGDLGCYLPDGNISFMGRIDNQVKVRGFRIELGEIEAAINTHPNVNQAVVITTSEASGNKRLVAYLVTEQSLTNKELRDFLKTQIPEYMLPSAFVTLDKLPLTPNGKVDRKALPTPDNIERDNPYIPPRTAIELGLTQIWSSVIGINPIGVKDNFFDLGGHSLLAVRLISEIQTHFQVNLPLATLFQTPSIEELAVTIDSVSSENLWSSLVPIQPKGSLPPLFFVGGEGGNVLCFQGLAQYLENQPFYGLEPPGLDGVTEPLGSIEEIASHYITTIKSIQPVGPYYLGGHSFGGTVAFEMAQQLQNQGEEIAYIAILDSDPPTTEVNHQDNNLNRDDDSRWINELVPMIEELFEINLQISDATLASIPPEKQLNYFKQQLEMVGILPPKSDIKLVRGLLQVYKTQSQIEIDYVPQNTKPTPIALFCAEEADSGEEDCERLLESQNAALGWNQLSQREVEIHTVPGNHISILNEPNVKILAQTLQKSLEQTHISLGKEQQEQETST